VYIGNFGGNNDKGKIKNAVLNINLKFCVVSGDITVNCCRLYVCIEYCWYCLSVTVSYCP